MKKKIILTLTLLSLSGILFGCGLQTETKTTTATEAIEATDTTDTTDTTAISSLMKPINKFANSNWASLVYDTSTYIAYMQFGVLNISQGYSFTPYYAPSGMPYRYNVKTGELEDTGKIIGISTDTEVSTDTEIKYRATFTSNSDITDVIVIDCSANMLSEFLSIYEGLGYDADVTSADAK